MSVNLHGISSWLVTHCKQICSRTFSNPMSSLFPYALTDISTTTGFILIGLHVDNAITFTPKYFYQKLVFLWIFHWQSACNQGQISNYLHILSCSCWCCCRLKIFFNYMGTWVCSVRIIMCADLISIFTYSITCVFKLFYIYFYQRIKVSIYMNICSVGM